MSAQQIRIGLGAFHYNVRDHGGGSSLCVCVYVGGGGGGGWVLWGHSKTSQVEKKKPSNMNMSKRIQGVYLPHSKIPDPPLPILVGVGNG